MPDRTATLATVREKYPVYRDMGDEALGNALADKYPDAYGFLRGAAASEPTEGPDAVGRIKEWLLREPPAGSSVSPIGGDWPGRIGRAAGDLFLPGSVPDAARMAATAAIGGPGGVALKASARPVLQAAGRALEGGLVSGPLKRTIAGGLAGGGAALAQGRDFASSALEGGSQALSQFAGELLPGALKFGLTQRAAKPLLAAREAKGAHDRSMHEATTTLEAEGYKGDVAVRRTAEAARVREARAQHEGNAQRIRQEHAAIEETRQGAYRAAEEAKTTRHAADVKTATETHAAQVRDYQSDGAKAIADAYKAQVPALKDFPSTEAGLVDMVRGKGQQAVSARFDEALRDVVQSGRGKPLSLSLADAEGLGIPALRGARGTQIRTPAEHAAAMDDPRITVDAGLAAQAVTGRWKKNPGLYRRVVGALDEAGIGDPAARGEYKAFQALSQFADKSQMLKGEKFSAEAAMAAFNKLKNVDELRRRGQGDVFRGPIAEAARRPAPELRLPAEPPKGQPPRPLAAPLVPPFRRPAPSAEVPKPPTRVLQETPMPEGVETKTLPKIGFWQGAAIAEIPFLIGGIASGQHAALGYGPAAAAGGLLASGLSGRTIATKAPLSPLSRFATDVLPQPLAQETRRLVDEYTR